VLAQVDGGGPNGAGKMTTIRVIATLLEPMAGRVEVDGYDVSIDPHEVRRIIGYMPDHAGVYERVTVRESGRKGLLGSRGSGPHGNLGVSWWTISERRIGPLPAGLPVGAVEDLLVGKPQHQDAR
jgi:hypothetical protein